ncbi:MAG: M56 family metallopeptidase [Candidatus Kariarchaeaceae archaeon]
MATNVVALILLCIHMQPKLWFLFHFHNLMNKSHMVLFSFYNINFDYLSLIIIISYPLTLLLFFILSQTFLHIFSHWLDDEIDHYHINRIKNIRSNNQWLRGIDVKIINDPNPDAFSYAIFYAKWFGLKIERVIVLTTSLLNLIHNDDEVEAIIAHEYGHTKGHHTLFSNIFVFINALFFFLPIFKISKNMAWQNNEIKADNHAISLINNPLSLARALFNLYLVENEWKSSTVGVSSLNSDNKNSIVNRINIIIKYSENAI